MCAHHLLEHAANQWPQRIAFSWDVDPRSSSLPHELTYYQLLAWAQATAASLRVEFFDSLNLDNSALGRPLIAIAVDEGPLLVLAMTAAWIAGSAIVPVDASEPLPRLRGLLEDAQPHLVLAPAHHLKRLAEASKDLEGALVDLEAFALKALKQMLHDASDCIITIDSTSTGNGNTNTRSGSNSITSKKSSCKYSDDDFDESMEAVSYIWYTSGSTGFPKGCVMPVRAILAYAEARNQAHRIAHTPQARVLMASAFIFDPCVGDVVSCWASGACLCLPSIRSTQTAIIDGVTNSTGKFATISSSSSSNDSSDSSTTSSSVDNGLGATLHRTKATHVCSTPALFAPLAAQGWTPVTLPFLRVVALGGEPATPAVLAAWGDGDGLPLYSPLFSPQSTDIPMNQAAAAVGSTESGEMLQRRSARVLLLNTYGVTEVCCYQTAAVLHSPTNNYSLESSRSSSRSANESENDSEDVVAKKTVDGIDGIKKKESPSKGSANVINNQDQDRNLDSWQQLELPHSTKPGCAGAALPGCVVWIVKPGTLEAVDHLDQEGEVCLGGPQVALGFWRRPDLSAAKFLKRNDATLGPPCSEGNSIKHIALSYKSTPTAAKPSSQELVYLTGDLGRWHHASNDSMSTFSAFHGDVTWNQEGVGWLELLGRADAQLKVHGRRTEAGEVEALFMAGDDYAPAFATETLQTGAASTMTSAIQLREVMTEGSVEVEIGATASAPSEQITGSHPTSLFSSRMLQACAATVALDGRLAVLAVPTPEVWKECFAASSNRQSAARTEIRETDDGGDDSSDSRNESPSTLSTLNGSSDGVDVWEHEGLGLALRRRAAVASPEALVPSVVAFVQTLPLTATGKVARGTLADFIATRKPIVHPSVESSSEETSKDSQNGSSSSSNKAMVLAATVANLWERLLGLAPSSIDIEVDDFSSLGGDSLLALRVSRELVQLFFHSSNQEFTTIPKNDNNTTTNNKSVGGSNSNDASADAASSGKAALHVLLGGDTGTLRGALAPHRMLGPGRTALQCATDLLAANHATVASETTRSEAVAIAALMKHTPADPDALPSSSSPSSIQRDSVNTGGADKGTGNSRKSNGHNNNDMTGNDADTSTMYGADTSSNNHSGATPGGSIKERQNDRLLDQALRRAASAGESSLVCLLAHLGADFGPRLKKKTLSSLSLPGAAGRDSADEDQEHLSNGTRRPLKQQTPLHMAAASGQASVVQLLLTLGVDPRATDSSGRMASHAAAQSPNHAVLGLLLREGVCPLTAKDKNKQTVLHHAARSGFSATLAHALQRWLQPSDESYVNRPGAGGGGGAKAYSRLQGGVLDWRDRWGRTAIHWCVLNQHADCLEVLLAAGADPEPGPARGLHKRTSLRPETPLEIARRLRSEVIDSVAAAPSMLADDCAAKAKAVELRGGECTPVLNGATEDGRSTSFDRKTLTRMARIEAVLMKAAEAKQ